MPIYPYTNTSVLVGIGQRYNVIVEADPRANDNPAQPMAEKDKPDEFWIRTWVAEKCGIDDPPIFSKTYEQTGIVRYGSSSEAEPRSSPWGGIPLRCSDETYTSLRPVLPWIVGTPVNPMKTGAGLQHMSIVSGKKGQFPSFPEASLAFRNVSDDLEKFHFSPLQIDYADPIMLHLNGSAPWSQPFWEIYPEGRTGVDDDWVSLPRDALCPLVH